MYGSMGLDAGEERVVGRVMRSVARSVGICIVSGARESAVGIITGRMQTRV
jgi:hypothetical protein